MDSIILILLWLLIWIVFAGFFELVMVRRGINHLKKFYITSIYFFGFAIISFLIFRKDIAVLVPNITITAISLLVLYYVVTIIIYFVIKKNLGSPREFITKNPKLYFVQLDWRDIISNTFVIVCQQILLLSIASILKQNGFSILMIIFLLVIFSIITHVSLFYTIGRWWGLCFLIFSSLYAIIYPLLVFNIKNGPAYAFMIHSAFYTISGVSVWFYYKLRKQSP